MAPSGGGALIVLARDTLILATATWVLFATCLAHAQAPLTVAEAERTALAREGLIQLLSARRDSAAGDVTAASAWPNPELSVSRESIDLADTTSRERFYWLYQSIDVSGERGLRSDAASQRLEAAQHAASAERLEIRAQVQRLFFETLYQQSKLQIVKRSQQRLASLVTRVRKQHEAGQAAAYDVVRLERALSALDTRAVRASAEGKRVYSELMALLGMEDIESARPLEGQIMPTAPLSLDAYLEQGNGLPRLKELKARARADELTARAEQRAAIPDIRVGVGRKELRENGRQFDGNMVSLSISVPLFDRNQGERARARANAVAKEAQHSLARARLTGEIRGRRDKLQALIKSAKRFERNDTETAGALLQAAEAGYRGGEAGVLELVDAYQNVLDAQLRLLEFQKHARDTFIELETLNPRITYVE